MHYDVAHAAVSRLAIRFQGSVDGGARVDNDHIAGIEKVGEIEEACMCDRVIFNARHHQAHLISRKPANLGRFVRRELVGDLKVHSCFDCDHAASASEVSSAEAT